MSGGEDRIARLYAQHHRALVRGLWSFGDVAEDAAMFAWEQAAAGLLPADHPDPFGWLRLTARRAAIRLVEVRGGEVVSLADSEGVDRDVPGGVDVEGDVLDELERVEVRRWVAELPSPAQRVALGLWARGYSYDEIADITGRSLTWVNRHVSEGKAALRAMFGRP